MSDRCPEDNADQPPEVDIHDDAHRLPTLDAAAHRVIEFISWFGDGEVCGSTFDGQNPPLYSRDLSVLATLALGQAKA